MAQKTGIEWTDASSNPLKYRDRATGKDVWACVKHSPGCANCYAETLVRRFSRGGPFNKVEMEKVEPYLCEKELRKLLNSKSLVGKRVFMCDMTDLFGEWVPDEMLDRLFAVMAWQSKVTFQVLTKRADRMRDYMTRLSRGIGPLENAAREMSRTFKFKSLEGEECSTLPWPIPNVWLGVSVEDQKRADERIPHLLTVPAAVRFLSCEPLLELVNLTELGGGPEACPDCGEVPTINCLHLPNISCACCEEGAEPLAWHRLDWVIIGGESGSGARPMHLEWARSLVEQCRSAGVACFVKQLGAVPVMSEQDSADCEAVDFVSLHGGLVPLGLDKKGGDIEEFPADLRVRQFPTPRTSEVP